MTDFISGRTRKGNVKKIDEMEKKMSELLSENSVLKDGKIELENEVARLTCELNKEKEKSKQQQHQIELMQQGYSIYCSRKSRKSNIVCAQL